MARGKYGRLPDLFVDGKELVFADDTVMWLQVLNPFEIDEARKDASAARSRLTLALKTFGSPDYDTMRGAFKARPTDEIINEMLAAKGGTLFSQAQDSLTSDPEWAERLEIARRFDEHPPQDDSETQLLEKINRDYLEEITKRTDDERAYLQRSWTAMSEEELLEEYEELWLSAKGQDAALKSFQVAEVYYGSRVCSAVPTADGYFNDRSHAECNSHRELVFEDKAEIRDLPKSYYEKLRVGFADLAMSERDARFSASQGSSSASSPLPSEVEASTPSTPDTTSDVVPGT